MDYLISDLSLDHTNIIEYCDRPFSPVEEMNEALVEQWNREISPEDSVLYGGDLTIRSSAAALLDWLEQLNGEIMFVLGNHDNIVLISWTMSSSSRKRNSPTEVSRSTLSMIRQLDPRTRQDGSSTDIITTTGPRDSRSSAMTTDGSTFP